jgi:hypothetical protein
MNLSAHHQENRVTLSFVECMYRLKPMFDMEWGCGTTKCHVTNINLLIIKGC